MRRNLDKPINQTDLQVAVVLHKGCKKRYHPTQGLPFLYWVLLGTQFERKLPSCHASNKSIQDILLFVHWRYPEQSLIIGQGLRVTVRQISKCCFDDLFFLSGLVFVSQTPYKHIPLYPRCIALLRSCETEFKPSTLSCWKLLIMYWIFSPSQVA